ncbi:syntaxin-18 [Venturia canescens]|uniref:syntaxin-18 n=1 Tax=Venturia canescens TaxID=32260 RepID=UPI001C9C7FA3|nr:syntaxin-18 [Venturia canescens]XP_043284764.1 syntaxin-18 [Venturia canescens]
MDVSTLFRASVKTVTLRKRDLEENDIKPSMKKLTRTSEFCKKAQAVVTQIFKLREFLLEKRSAYLNFSNHLASKGHMSDEERDQLDQGSQKIMSTCSQLIKELKRETAETEVSPQTLEHREIMLFLIEEYLKSVCKIYSEQKAIRVKRAMETRKLAKLELESRGNEHVAKLRDRMKLNGPNELSVESKDLVGSSTESSPMKVQEINGDVSTLNYDEELTAEDIQMFESENEQLHNELNTITEEVKQIESKVVHIAELQEIFTEKVLDQDKDLDRLMTTVVGSTENVKKANEQIREAIQRNAGLRVWILFFLLVMSFSLLFLDWYNP